LNNITMAHVVKYTLPILKKLEVSVIVSSWKYKNLQRKKMKFRL
jgi:hypothetical protein